MIYIIKAINNEKAIFKPYRNVCKTYSIINLILIIILIIISYFIFDENLIDKFILKDQKLFIILVFILLLIISIMRICIFEFYNDENIYYIGNDIYNLTIGSIIFNMIIMIIFILLIIWFLIKTIDQNENTKYKKQQYDIILYDIYICILFIMFIYILISFALSIAIYYKLQHQNRQNKK